jgi:hypothetical protein
MLTRLEREVITDSMLKIQSIEASLSEIDDSKIANVEDVHSCLKTASRTFRAALKGGCPKQKR